VALRAGATAHLWLRERAGAAELRASKVGGGWREARVSALASLSLPVDALSYGRVNRRVPPALLTVNRAAFLDNVAGAVIAARPGLTRFVPDDRTIAAAATRFRTSSIALCEKNRSP